MSNIEIKVMYKRETGMVPESGKYPIFDEDGDIITFDEDYISWLEDKVSFLLKKTQGNG